MAEFNKNTYHDQVNNINTLKLRQMQNTLPKFLRDFFLGIKDTTSTRTRLAYAYDSSFLMWRLISVTAGTSFAEVSVPE